MASRLLEMHAHIRRETALPDDICALVIDMQEGYLSYHDENSRSKLITAQLEVIDFLKERGNPICWLEYWGSYGQDDTTAAIRDSISSYGRTCKFLKEYNDGFTNPMLRKHIDSMGSRNLLIMGINKSYCVLSTAKSAAKHGYDLFSAKQIISDHSNYIRCDASTRQKSEEWFERNTTYYDDYASMIDISRQARCNLSTKNV